MFKQKLCLLVVLLVLHLLNSAWSAEFSLNIESELCSYSIDGIINKGDYERFVKFREEAQLGFRETTSACLNSPGGYLREAVRFAELFRNEGIGTVVNANDECLSACAIIFMSGTFWGPNHNLLDRKLHILGRLGFHRPNVEFPADEYSKKDMEYAFDTAVNAVILMANFTTDIEQNPIFRDASNQIMSPLLLEKILKHKGSEFYYVTTVGQVGEWGIEVFGTDLLNQSLGDEEAFTACVNYTDWKNKNFEIISGIHPKYSTAYTSKVKELDNSTKVYSVSYIEGYDGAQNYSCAVVFTKKGNESEISIVGRSACAQNYPESSDVNNCYFERFDSDASSILVHQRDIPLSKLPATSRYLSNSPIITTVTGEYTKLENFDLVGKEIGRSRSPNIETCSADCRGTRGCEGFTFDSWNGWCFLKQEIREIRKNAKAESWITYRMRMPPASELPISIRRFNGKYFPGESYSEVKTKDLADCEYNCRVAGECIAYTWYRTEKLCKRFSKVGEGLFK